MKVLLILVDGMRPDALPKVDAAQKIISKSAYNMNAQTVMPSVTFPCHMSLFHSVDPGRHGTTTNTYMPQVRPIDGLCEVLSRAKKYDIQFTVKENLDVLADRYKKMEIDGLTIDKSEEPKLRQAVFDFIVENQSKLDPATFTVRKFGEIMKAVEDDYIVSSLSKQSSDVADYAYDEDDADGWKSIAMDILNKADDGSDFAETQNESGDKKAVANAMKKIKKNNPKLYKELLSDDDEDVDDKELTGTADSDDETDEAEKALQSDMSLDEAEELLLG